MSKTIGLLAALALLAGLAAGPQEIAEAAALFVPDLTAFQWAAILFGLATAVRSLSATLIRMPNGWREFSQHRAAMKANIAHFARGGHLPPERVGSNRSGGVLILPTASGSITYEDKDGKTEFEWDLSGNRLATYAQPFTGYNDSKERYHLIYILDRLWRGSVGDGYGAGIRRGLDCLVMPVVYHFRPQLFDPMPTPRWKIWKIRPFQAPLQRDLMGACSEGAARQDGDP